MKAIILISSIFYILGLKVGNNINLATDSTSVKQVTVPQINQSNIIDLNNKNNLLITDSLNTNHNVKKLENVSE